MKKSPKLLNQPKTVTSSPVTSSPVKTVQLLVLRQQLTQT
ncbi:hypothetical protein CWATWH0402_5808 [Crocosphaera watsonii WH 0402]|uniref:Uncharacterized protein n=2 Tax=Crocosphaera watsonii TaxID=263511 RepID=T2JSB5_CROWT|nr:hypothetical protein CWATWH0005_5586 [Crocosphaera watsonii WH 0005]CCQ68115.1 hypothetical protein CWATWH0402_5808 [Crocosphaera watsonii WH 0402]